MRGAPAGPVRRVAVTCPVFCPVTCDVTWAVTCPVNCPVTCPVTWAVTCPVRGWEGVVLQGRVQEGVNRSGSHHADEEGYIDIDVDIDIDIDIDTHRTAPIMRAMKP